ncbi:50S ribosomal protein L28 [Alphaproteobacteria bacterium]|jgi:large subunit ribosomal protein L28|nr:50S ribosomal protein L28 [Alphaproteobacteria bacterium]MDA8695082.1 50S ribosomal protein L28 [Alphaproteobacteria bacterium]|tara:strand:+ start:511 stop:804 length:294 start_codon:yes stop_codon:yes gene_type:complete
MSRACEITGKKHQTGHNVSHSNIKTKRRFMVNLNSVTLFSETLKRKFRFRIASSTLRTIDKHGGIDQYLNNTSSRLLTDKALKLKKQIEKNVSQKAN